MTLKKWLQDISGKTARDERLVRRRQHYFFQDQIAKLAGLHTIFCGSIALFELQEKVAAEILGLCESDVLAEGKEAEPNGYHYHLLQCRADLALAFFGRLREHGFIESGDLYLGNVKAFEHVSSEKVLKFMKHMLCIIKEFEDQDFQTMAFRLFDVVAADVSTMIDEKEKRKEFIIKVRQYKILRTLDALYPTDFSDFTFAQFERYYDNLSFHKDSFHWAYPGTSQVNGIQWQGFGRDHVEPI